MAIMNESELKKHISSKEIKNLYLIYGDEKMLIKTFTESLTELIAGNDRNDLNYYEFDNDSEISDISIAVDVMPFVKPINFVKIKDYNFDSLNSDDFDSILEIIKNVPSTTTILFTMPTLEVEEKKNFKKVKTYIEKNGIVANIEHRGELKLEKVLCRWAKQASSSMTEVTASRLIKYVGTDLNVLHTEIEKLSAYADGKEITVEMIEKLVNENLEAKVFDLFNFVITKNVDKAMTSLDVLFYQREEPITIAIILGNAYVDAYRVRAAYESGISMHEVAEKFGYKNREWVLDKINRQIKGIPNSSLRESIDEIIKTQEKLVSVTINSQIELQKLISKLVILAGRKSDE